MEKIPGFEDYFITEDGRVFRELRRLKTQRGYVTVNIRNKPRLLHRLLAQTFLPNPTNLPQVNHKNGVKHDFALSNLEWCTPSQNLKHAYDMGLLKIRPRPKGMANSQAKLTDDDVREIRHLKSMGMYHYDIAWVYRLNVRTVVEIVTRQRWKHVV